MENCQYDYNNALEILRDAYPALSSNNYKGLKSSIINAANGLAACDQSYKDPPTRTSPMADALSKALKKSDIVVAVMDTVSP